MAKSFGLDRVVDVLRALSGAPLGGITAADVAAATGLGRSSAYRLLASLRNCGLVEQDSESKRYWLGYEIYVLGRTAAHHFSIVRLAQPSLVRLAEQTQDTVYMSAPSQLDAICVAREEGSFPIKTLSLTIGQRRPLGVGTGALALLSALDDAEVEQVVQANMPRYGGFPGFDPASIYDLVAETREQGYAYSNDLIVKGMRAVAVPIRDPDGFPVAAITVSAISERMEKRRRESTLGALVREQKLIQQKLAGDRALPTESDKAD
jgi:DNA-binding IclR family transcriptional regulator